MKRRAIKPGELLALYPKALRGAGPKAFFDLWPSPMPENEREGRVCVVHVRGPLEHHADVYCDSYDAIKGRVEDAFEGPEDEDPPVAVVLRIDSPGGVVSGLNECVKSLRAMSEACGIPLYAYVDEMAASAAYAIASSCDAGIYMPPSAIAGSVGVISTMVDQTEFDERMGFRFVTLTSGARKSDGHPHVAISDEAKAAEQGRVDRLARQFYKLVERSRGMSVKQIAKLEAGIFVGVEAVAKGLADDVMSWPEFLAAVETAAQDASLARVGQNVSGSRVPSSSKGNSMLKLKAAIAAKTKAIKAEKSKKARAKLKGELTILKAALAMLDARTTHTIEHRERHVADDGDEDDVDDGSEDEDEDEDEAEDEEEEAGGNETDRSDEEDEDEEEEEEASYEGEEEEAAGGEFLRAAVRSLPKSQRTKAMALLAALQGKAKMYDAHGARLAKLEADRKNEKKASSIAAALAARRVTPHEAKTLAKKSPKFVAEFLAMRPKAIVHGTSEGAAAPPGTKPEAVALTCTDEELLMFQAASVSSGIPVEKLVEHHRAEMAKLNGAAGAGSY